MARICTSRFGAVERDDVISDAGRSALGVDSGAGTLEKSAASREPVDPATRPMLCAGLLARTVGRGMERSVTEETILKLG